MYYLHFAICEILHFNMGKRLVDGVACILTEFAFCELAFRQGCLY